MGDWIKVTAKTVDDAVMEASIQLGTSRDNIEYRVIEKETKGFLGLGAKPAVIEAKTKAEEEDIVKELFSENAPAPKKEAPKAAKREEEKKVKEKAPEKKKEKPQKAKKKAEEVVKEEVPSAVSPKEEIKKEIKEEKKAPKAPRTPADPEEAMKCAEEFLSSMFQAMGMEVAIDTVFEEDTLNIELSGSDMGVLIGKRGQTLDSVQYLTSLVVNKGKASYVRVKIDTEDYRARRKATLENLAKNIAFKVKKTGRPVFLEPMNPYERRIIHYALQNDPYVTTHSEGEEPNRKVVVTVRRKEQ